VKHLFLTVSVFTLLSTPSFATWQQDVADEVNLEVGQNKIILKLLKSQDYTINLDEGALTNTIIKIVQDKNEGKKGGREVKAEDIKFETRRQIVNTLEGLKTSRTPIGHGYYLTKNFRGDALCVESGYNPLVYAIKSSEREKPDGFLPVTYKSNFMSQKLCEEIDYYASNNGLSKDEAKRLNRYLQPLFFIIQQEVSQMLEGNKSLLHSQRWVYGKDYSGIVKSVKKQTEHHHALIKNSGLKGFTPSVVEDSLVPSLVNLAISLIPKPYTMLKAGKNLYVLGMNARNELSLIHPDNGLPYPVLPSSRGSGDMNLPSGYKNDQFLRNQWQRVDDYVRGDYRIAPSHVNRMKVLLEPIGYLFRQAIDNLHVSDRDYPDKQEAEDRLIRLATDFVQMRSLPIFMLDTFYKGNVNLYSLIEDVKNKGATHLAMTDDLVPVSVSPHSKDVINNLVEYLTLQDMIDRFKHFYPYEGSKLQGLGNMFR